MRIELNYKQYNIKTDDIIEANQWEILDLAEELLDDKQKFELVSNLQKILIDGYRYYGNYNINAFVDIFRNLAYDEQQSILQRLSQISPSEDYYKNAHKILQENNKGA